MPIQIIPAVGIATISIANPSRDGQGLILDLITGAAEGTVITSLTIKATDKVQSGMVRLYIKADKGNPYRIIREVKVDTTSPTGQYASFCRVLHLDSICLAPGMILAASTEQSNSFSVLANGYSVSIVS